MGFNYLVIIPILAFLIIIHELGHFWAARSVGVKVEEFGIGLPPRVKGWKRKGVLWSLNALPIGGFVRVKGEDAADMEPGSMNAASPWERGWFLIAGPLMNLLAAFLIAMVLIGFQGVPTNDSYVTIAAVEPNSPAAEAGWKPGDRMVSIDGQEITSTQQAIDYVNDHQGEEMQVVLQRGNENLTTAVTPRTDPPAGEGSTGIRFGDSRLSDVTVMEITPGSLAADLGLQENDEIIRIGDVEIVSLAQAVGTLDALAGEETTITYARDGQEHTAKVAVPTPSLTVNGDVAGDTPAGRAEIYKTDRIVSINGEPVTTGNNFINTLIANSNKPVELDIIRTTNDGPVDMTVSLAVPNLEDVDRTNVLPETGLSLTEPSAFRAIGLIPVGHPLYENVSAGELIPRAWDEFTAIIGGTVDGVGQLISGDAPAGSLMGPIGMAQFTGEMLETTPNDAMFLLLRITMLISISLGLLNLLPIPALDGGRLLFVILEILRGGKRIPPEKEGAVHMVGMLFLLGLIAFVAFGDISRLMNGEGFFN